MSSSRRLAALMAVALTIFVLIILDQFIDLGYATLIIGIFAVVSAGFAIRHLLLAPLLGAVQAIVVFMLAAYVFSPSDPDVGPIIGVMQTTLYVALPSAALGLFGAILAKLAANRRLRHSSPMSR